MASSVPGLAYFDIAQSSNGRTEGISGPIELRRRVACRFRDHDSYRLRVLPIGGGSPALTQ